MRYGTPKIASLTRSLQLLEAIVADGGAKTTMDHAGQLGIPHATAHRIVRTLVSDGFLIEISRGRHIAGTHLRDMLGHVSDWQEITAIGRPILKKFAAKLNCVAHLGVLEDGMVTYLVREGSDSGNVFTREGSQLEAYCSALGKILLAHLPPEGLNAYLSSGPFVPLTTATITDASLVREEFERAKVSRIAWDREEIAVGLFCCAAPVVSPGHKICFAVSLSFGRAGYLSLGDVAIAKAAAELAKRVTRAAAERQIELAKTF
ncbi:MAG: IclR family transcriptional regulator [Sphingomonadaceae bacterium]